MSRQIRYSLFDVVTRRQSLMINAERGEDTLRSEYLSGAFNNINNVSKRIMTRRSLLVGHHLLRIVLEKAIRLM